MRYRDKSGKISDISTNELDILIPSSIFCDRSLSFFEVLVAYLRETRKLSYHEIADLTNRDQRNIWTVYQRAAAKRERLPKQIRVVSNIFIPLSVLRDRSVSVLEVVVAYLKKNTKLSNHQIARLLNRSDKTIWTVHNRAKKKWKKN